MQKLTKKDIKTAAFGLDVLLSLADKRKINKGWIGIESYTSKIEEAPMIVFSKSWADSTHINVGVVIKGNKLPVIHNYATCYGCMDTGANNVSSDSPTRGTIIIFAGIPVKYQTKDHLKEALFILDWLINKSPWSSCVLTNDPMEALKRGILLNATAPVNIVFGALLMYKNIYIDLYKKVKIWSSLVKEGCNVDIAVIQAFVWGAHPGNYGPRGYCSNVFVECMFNKEPITRFIKNEPVYKSEPYTKINKYRNLGYSEFNDSTISHTFITKEEWDKYRIRLHTDRYSNNLIKSLQKSFSKTLGDVTNNRGRGRDTNGNLKEEENAKIFVAWSKEQFPFAYPS